MPKPFRAAILCATALLALSLSACGGGGGGDDDDDELIPAFGVIGQADFVSARPNRGGSATAATLAQPLGNIATDGSKLYIADTANSRVLGFNSIPSSNGAVADFVLGQSSVSGISPGTAANRLAQPGSVYTDGNRLVVADSGNNRVLIWNTLPQTTGALPDVVLGQADFNSSQSGTSERLLAYPTAAILAGNRLVVADQNNNRVLVWNQIPTVSNTPADQVLGQTSFVTNVAEDAAEQMNRPVALWSDGFRLLVADSGNNRVLAWQLFPQQQFAARADYVIGQTDFNRSTVGSSSSTLRTPFGVSSDGTYLYIADSGNNRVLRFDGFPLANGLAASEVYGQADFTHNTANDADQDADIDDTPDATTLNGASGVYVSNGVLYVTDRNNNRVLQFPQ